MNIVVTGSRDWPEDRTEILHTAFEGYNDPSLDPFWAVGDCPTGVDKIFRDWAERNIKDGDWREFKADWDRYGRAAGPDRNSRMVRFMHPDFVLAFFVPGKECRGTWDCVEQAQKLGAEIIPYRLK